MVVDIVATAGMLFPQLFSAITDTMLFSQPCNCKLLVLDETLYVTWLTSMTKAVGRLSSVSAEYQAIYIVSLLQLRLVIDGESGIQLVTSILVTMLLMPNELFATH